MKQAAIRTAFGEISIRYQTSDELHDALKTLEEEVNTIEETTKKISPPPQRTAKPGYENAYRFLPNGQLELLYFPRFKNQTVALALFAYYPESLTEDQITNFTGITQAERTVLGQTENQNYFLRKNDKYTLAFDGFTLVKQKIGDVLARSAGTPPPEPERPQDEHSQ